MLVIKHILMVGNSVVLSFKVTIKMDYISVIHERNASFVLGLKMTPTGFNAT